PVVEPPEVRVGPAGGGARLAEGTPAQLFALVFGEADGEDDLLDRHLAVQDLVVGLPDPAHAADAQRGAKPVPSGNPHLRSGHTDKHISYQPLSGPENDADQ